MSHKLMARTRTQLLLNEPFFGSLAMHLALKEDASIPTASVDGTTLKYNPEFMASLTDHEQRFVLAHEVMHCALGHMWRRGSRDKEGWNIATDYVINDLLKQAGFPLIKGVKYDASFTGMSAEQIYSKMQSDEGSGQSKQDGQTKPASGSDQAGGTQLSPGGQEVAKTPAKATNNGSNVGGTPCPTGDFTDAPEPAEDDGQAVPAMTEDDWQVAAAQAEAVASAAGSLPGAAGIELTKSRQPKLDWVAELKEYIVKNNPADYSWMQPNRRYVAGGYYLPGTVKENLGEIVIAIDVSGSTLRMREIFAGEFNGILSETRPERVHVVYCDASIQRHDEMTVDDFDVDMKSVGNGGTRFAPVFEYVEQQAITPSVLIYLTDLECCDKPVEPSYPVLWLAPDYVRYGAPGFGDVIHVPDEGRH